MFSDWGEKIKTLTGSLVVLLGLTLPLSVYASDIIVFLIVFLWLIEGRWLDKWSVFLKSKLSVAIVLFLGFYFLGLFWGEINHYSIKWIQKQAVFLLAPVLITSNLSSRFIKLSIICFFIGVFVNSLVALGGAVNWWDIDYFHYKDEKVLVGFLDHFDYSLFLAFCSLFLIASLFFLKFKKPVFWSLVLICLFFVINLFLSHGRAGQYAFLLVLFVFLIYRFRKKPKHLFSGFFAFCLLISFLFCVPNTFKNRFDLAVFEYHDFFRLLENWEKERVGPRSSVGNRLTYGFNYMKIIKQNPFLGSGTGCSILKYNQLENKIFPGIPARPPHNNYLFILAEVGFLGLFFWLLIFLCLFKDLQKTKLCSRVNVIKLLFPLLFLIVCFSDEYLVRHNPSLFFVLMVAFFSSKKLDLNVFFNLSETRVLKT